MRVTSGIAGLSCLLCLGGLARAETWALAPFATRGIDPEAAMTFQGLVRDELAAEGKLQFADLPEHCAGAACRPFAAEAGAEVLVTGELSALGSKIIVSVTASEVSGEVRRWQKMTVDRLEDLEQAAGRIARGLLGRGEAKKEVELGGVTEAEARDVRRREGRLGPALRLGVASRIRGPGDSGSVGVLVDVAYWYEALHFGIEPRLGVRRVPGYFELPLDVGAFYIFSKSDFAPFLGAGAGLRYVWESREELTRLGTVAPMVSQGKRTDDALAFGVYLRGGVLLLRTYTMRLAVTAELTMTFAELNDRRNPAAATGGIAVYF